MKRFPQACQQVPVLICSAIFFAAVAAGQQSNQQTVRYPGKQWLQYQIPEHAGYSSEKLKQVAEICRQSDVAGLLVVYDGAVLFRYGDVETRYMCHSIRKSFMSILYGIYIDRGTIDPNRTLEQLKIDDIPAKLSADEKQAKISDLLKSRSGVYHSSAYEPGNMKKTRPKRGSHRPGSHWWYNNWDFNALLTIFEQETGQKFFQCFRDQIAKPLQFQDFRIRDGYYHVEPKNSKHAAYPFRLSARDMARIGWLMACHGRWNDRQIVSADWVKESTQAHSKIGNWNGYQGYGYMWWIRRTDDEFVFSAFGSGNNSIDVLPDKKLVFVFRADTYHGKNINLQHRRRILRGVMEAKTERPIDKPRLVPLPEKNQPPAAVQLSPEYLKQFPLDLPRQLPASIPAEIRNRLLRIESIDNTLILYTQPPPALHFDLVPLGEDRFWLEGPNRVGIIDRDAEGKATRFLLKDDLARFIKELETDGKKAAASEQQKLFDKLFSDEL